MFNGTTYENYYINPESSWVLYEIIIGGDGWITVTLGDLRYTLLDGDGFMGLYVQPLGMELGLFMPPPHTSWHINTKLHKADTETVDLAPGEEKNVTLSWDTSTLPHLSPFTLWVNANPGGAGETSSTNTLSTPIVMRVSPPPGAVGGQLLLGGGGVDELLVATGAACLATATLLVLRRWRGA